MSTHRLTSARLAHALDALSEETEPVAGYLHAFFDSLTRAGFSREEALRLTIVMESTLVEALTAGIADVDSHPTEGPEIS